MPNNDTEEAAKLALSCSPMGKDKQAHKQGQPAKLASKATACVNTMLCMLATAAVQAAHPFAARQGAMGAWLYWARTGGGVVGQAAVAAHHPCSLLVAQPTAVTTQALMLESRHSSKQSCSALTHPVLRLPAFAVLLRKCTLTVSHRLPCLSETDCMWAVGA